MPALSFSGPRVIWFLPSDFIYFGCARRLPFYIAAFVFHVAIVPWAGALNLLRRVEFLAEGFTQHQYPLSPDGGSASECTP